MKPKGQVVNDDDLIYPVLAKERSREVGTDEACASRDEDLHRWKLDMIAPSVQVAKSSNGIRLVRCGLRRPELEHSDHLGPVLGRP